MSFDPHSILGVEPGTDAEHLKRAWHDRLRLYHPDRLGPAPAPVIKAAESMTKLINAAYDSLRSRSDNSSGGLRRSGPSDRWGTAEFPSARDFVNRARSATDYADSLLDRWRQSRRGFEVARGKIRESMEVVAERVNEIVLIEERLRAAPEACIQAASGVFRERLVLPTLRLLEPAENTIMRASSHRETMLNPDPGHGRPHGGRRDDYTLSKGDMRVVEEALSEAETGPHRDPEAITLALSDVHGKMASVRGRFARLVSEADVLSRECSSARDRGSKQLRSINQLARDIEKAVADSQEPITRSVIAAASAVGLSQTELKVAGSNHEEWLSTRTLEDAQILKTRAEQLSREWTEAHRESDTVREELLALRELVGVHQESTKRGLAAVESFAECLQVAESVADRAGMLAISRMEEELLARFDAVKAAVVDGGN